MVGVTLSPEQIRNAPPEVRRWLEQELLATLGLQQPAADLEAPQLAALGEEEAAGVLSLIQGMLPVMNVFFELGREGIGMETEGLAAFRLADILRHTRLQTPEQVVACLDTISAAARRVSGDPGAAFYGLDNRGHCFISALTRRSISHVWQEIIAARNLDASTAEALRGPAAEPALAPSAIPLAGVSGSSLPIWSAAARAPGADGADRTSPGVAPGGSAP